MFGCGRPAMTAMVGGGAATTVMVGDGTAMIVMVEGGVAIIIDQPRPWQLSDDVSDSHARTGNRSIFFCPRPCSPGIGQCQCPAAP